MRILQIMNRVPWPLKDGGSLGYYNYAKGYADAGVDLTVCALNTNKHFFKLDDLPEHVKHLGKWHATEINTDVKAVDALLNLFGSKSYNIERFYSIEFEQLLLKTIAENTFDVIVFESIFVAPYIDKIRNKTKAICILREHNVEFQIWETLAKGSNNPIKKAYLKLLASRMQISEKKYLNCFDGITTVTSQDAQVFKLMGCVKPIFVSPFGIDITRIHPGNLPQEVNSVFHLGSMEWLPNQQAMHWFLKEVWPSVLKEIPTAKFYLAGRGMPLSFNQYISDSVKIIGEVDDAVSFMQQKQLMIVPLFAGSGIRVKILEGMAMGNAILTTSLGVQGIEGIDGVHFAIANNPSDFVKGIIKLLKHPHLMAEMSKEARKLAAEKYDNTKVIANVLSFYNELLKKQ